MVTGEGDSQKTWVELIDYTPENEHFSPENGSLQKEIPALETIVLRGLKPLIFGAVAKDKGNDFGNDDFPSLITSTMCNGLGFEDLPDRLSYISNCFAGFFYIKLHQLELHAERKWLSKSLGENDLTRL